MICTRKWGITNIHRHHQRKDGQNKLDVIVFNFQLDENGVKVPVFEKCDVRTVDHLGLFARTINYIN